MAAYQNMLVPTYFSTFSEAAVIRAKELAAVYDSRLFLLHVLDHVPPGYVAVELPEKYGSVKWLVEQAGLQLEEWAEGLGLSDVDKWVRVGSPKRVVVDVAREAGADLIIIGTSGTGIFKRIIGSTTTGVLQHAPCDVLSVQTAPDGPA